MVTDLVLFLLFCVPARSLLVTDPYAAECRHAAQTVRGDIYIVHRNGPLIHAIADSEGELFEVRGHLMPNGKMRLVLFNQNGYMDTWDYPGMPNLYHLMGK